MIPSDVVAARVRELRKKRGLTAQELADRCAALGAKELTAASVANIETGRRKNGRRTRVVTVDEVLALAYVLDAPVALLLLPLDAEELPITPEVKMHPGDVIAWLAGDAEPNPERRKPWMESVGAVVLYKELRRWMAKSIPADEPDSVHEAHLEVMARVLDRCSEEGLRLWPLPRRWVEILRDRNLVRYPDALVTEEEGTDG